MDDCSGLDAPWRQTYHSAHGRASLFPPAPPAVLPATGENGRRTRSVARGPEGFRPSRPPVVFCSGACSVLAAEQPTQTALSWHSPAALAQSQTRWFKKIGCCLPRPTLPLRGTPAALWCPALCAGSLLRPNCFMGVYRPRARYRWSLSRGGLTFDRVHETNSGGAVGTLA